MKTYHKNSRIILKNLYSCNETFGIIFNRFYWSFVCLLRCFNSTNTIKINNRQLFFYKIFYLSYSIRFSLSSYSGQPTFIQKKILSKYNQYRKISLRRFTYENLVTTSSTSRKHRIKEIFSYFSNQWKRRAVCTKSKFQFISKFFFWYYKTFLFKDKQLQ